MWSYDRGALGYDGERLGARHCASAAPPEAKGDAAQVSMDLRAQAEADEHHLNMVTTKALMLRAAETIELQGMEIELQGMEIGDLEERLRVVEELLRDCECPQCFSYFAPKH